MDANKALESLLGLPLQILEEKTLIYVLNHMLKLIFFVVVVVEEVRRSRI